MRPNTTCVPVALGVAAALLLGPVSAAAQGGASGGAATGGGVTFLKKVKPNWTLHDRLYYEPLFAEQRAARIFILFPGFSEAFPHSVDRRSGRFAWQITMGREIPIVGWESRALGLTNQVGAGDWGVGIWVPISFHMIEDFQDESNPIVDTDYRFGFMLKGTAGLTDSMRVSGRYVPWAHESTHLGDEYILLAIQSPEFERINVSYEYQEYGLSLDIASTTNRSSLKVRHGGIVLHGEDGYYSDHLLGSDEPTLSVSQKNYEPSFGVEYRLPRQLDKLQGIVSVDVRNRLQYSFHHPISGEEQRRLTWTIAAGVAAQENDTGLLRGIVAYVTRGVNPYGQLREQYPYWSAGVGWMFR